MAARFPELERAELEAELAVTLLELRSRSLAGIRDWQAYLTKSLLNRASRLRQALRRRQEHERPIEGLPEVASLGNSEDVEPSAGMDLLKRLRKVLDEDALRLIGALEKADFNQSLAAQELGIHRNTLKRQLRRIQRQISSCPDEIVSQFSSPALKRRALYLTSKQRQQLWDLVQSSRTRESHRAQILLALSAGSSYREIQQTFHTSAPTIARWRNRFAVQGVESLRAKYVGKPPQEEWRLRLEKWIRERQSGSREPVSIRQMSRELGISKSTVHRLLTARERKAYR